MSGFDPDTLDFYAREAPVYTASGKGGTARHLDDFLDILPPNASILELGCGGGVDAARMIERGFLVEPTDGVPEIAAKAEKRLNHPVRVMRFDELSAAGHYDAVFAAASLLHVPRSDLVGILTRVWTALKPGGWHLATFKGGSTEGRDRFGRYFNYLSAVEAEAAYREAGDWAVLEISEHIGGGYDGQQGPWLKLLARKA
jgi:SAM-dependent methyltransferase